MHLKRPSFSVLMNLAERALRELFPDRHEPRKITVKYSRAFNPYNANVKYDRFGIEFRLSATWKEVSEEIVIGLLQSLFVKMYKKKKSTTAIQMYASFIKKLSVYSAPEHTDPVLEASFNRVNDTYFDGFMDRPNLVWGTASAYKLGSYEYATNTIMVSTLFKREEELLDYIMYHELLHKKLKYYEKNGRSFHHTSEFRKWEKKFGDPHIEEKLERFLKKHRFKNMFRLW